ncbi:putative uncharacterized protein DDB_G0286901 [Rhopalosiphum padi]|uniref:putative uncharacterized protein DDB_G0286901 n=1 Tax=Rhopalosiphum padi TaxID=40932 RepID=UPI00298E959A|nr:putative uncharacterized protein DDB_G0286901 [Rhopalosiphum padi]
MKIRTNLYLITAIVLSSNLLTLCEGDSDIDHEPFSDQLDDHLDDHLDHIDDLHDLVGPLSTNDKVIHSVELVQHHGDTMTKYATTSHTNQEANNEIFTNTIPTIQQSNMPATFTKVIKKTIIKKSNNDGNNSPETDFSMNDMYSKNILKGNGIGNSMSKSQTLSQMDNMENIDLSVMPSQQNSDLQGNIKNIIHTTVTKTTTSGSPSNELNESFSRKYSLDGLPSNHIISTMSSKNSNNNDGTAGSGSLQTNSMEGNSKIKTISMTGDVIDGNGINTSKRISRTPAGSYRRTKTTIIKQHSIDDDDDRSDLDKSTLEFNTETSPINIASSLTNPLGYNTVTTTTIDRDNSNNNAFNQGTSSRREQTRLNNFNILGNSVSESGISQNPDSFVQTKTTIIKNERAADGIKLDNLNDNKINFNIDDGISNSNNDINSNYIISSSNNGNDNDADFSYNYGYQKGYGNNLHDNYNGNSFGISENKYNGNIISSNMLDNKYVLIPEYSNGKGMKKKRKKKGSNKKYKGGKSKNISHGSRKGNEKSRAQKGRNYKKTRSSKTRNGGSSQYYSSNGYVEGQSKSLNGGSSQYYSSNGYVKGQSKSLNGGSSQYYSSNGYVKGQSKSLSSSDSASDEQFTNTKMPCHCRKGQKLNKRDSSESNQSGNSKEHLGPESHYLSNSMDNQQIKNNGDFIGLPSLLPPFMEREPSQNLIFDMISGQRPDKLFNDGQSGVTTVLNRQGETRSQQIDDHQLPNIDVPNQYLTYQITNMGSLNKPDFKHEQYFGPPDLDLGLGPDKGPGPGPLNGPGPGRGPGPDGGPGPGRGPGPRRGPGPGKDHGPCKGHGPGKGHGPCKGHHKGPGFGKGLGQEANLFDSKQFYDGGYQKYFDFDQRPSLPSLPSQFPYPYSFNKDNLSDFSKMDLTTPKFMNNQSEKENQINLNTISSQIQQNSDNEGSGFNQMDAVNSRSMSTYNSGPIIEFKKTIKTITNIDDNSTPDRHIVRIVSVSPEVDGNNI